MIHDYDSHRNIIIDLTLLLLRSFQFLRLASCDRQTNHSDPISQVTTTYGCVVCTYIMGWKHIWRCIRTSMLMWFRKTFLQFFNILVTFFWMRYFVSFIPYFYLFFGILVTLVAWFSFRFYRLAHLALQNINKDYIIFSYFSNMVARSDQKPKTKNGISETFISKMLVKFIYSE